MNTNANLAPPEQKPDLNVCIRIALAVISGMIAAGGMLRAADYGKWDWETLLYFLAAAVILLIPWIAKLKLGKDGFEFEFFKSVKNTLESNGVGGMNTPEAAPTQPEEATHAGQPQPIGLRNTIASIPAGGIENIEGTSGPIKTAGDTELPIDPNDPQRGRWGGCELNHQRRISATIKPVPESPEWFMVRLVVSTTSPDKPLAGKVIFHVHPTFKRPVIPVPVRGGKAVLELVAWGAFTVGAECDSGGTKLELNLSTLPDAPEKFLLR